MFWVFVASKVNLPHLYQLREDVYCNVSFLKLGAN